MKNSKSKAMATIIALFLLLTIAVPLAALPAANAHSPPWQIPTFAYISVTPNPIGMGQSAAVVIWLDLTPSGAGLGNSIRFRNYTLTITRPDNKTETMNWPYISDPTSSQYTHYTPSQVGVYTFKFSFPGMVYNWSGAYSNDVFLSSSASTTLTVQQQQIPAPIDSYPMPSAYWTRPIEGQNTYWYTIASQWLGTGSPQFNMGLKVQPDGIAPDSAHIMWTKPIDSGGVVGGNDTGIPGNAFYMGLDYNQRFTNAIIMNGIIYYELPYGNSGGGGGYIAVDLRSGEQLWWINTTSPTGIGVPSFGYLYDYESGNQHGVLNKGLLITSSSVRNQGTVWRAYDPTTGIPTTMNITNVPSSTLANFPGASGEQLRYVLANFGSTANPNYYLLEWNSSLVFGGGPPSAFPVPINWYSGTANASASSAYDWNVSIASTLAGQSRPSIVYAYPGDLLLGTSSSFQIGSSSTTYGTPNPFTFWAVSLNPSSLGKLLWIENYTPPHGPNGENVTLLTGPADPESGVFTMYEKETMQWYGYSLTNGSFLWGPTAPSQYSFNYYDALEYIPDNYAIVNGKLYYSGYGGVLYCYDATNGSLLWTYGNGGPGNSTYSGLETIWGMYPIWIGVICDGQVYLYTSEHSPNTPIYKGGLIRDINATTGQEIWTMMGYGGLFGPSTQMVEADGFLVYLNCYDMQIYCVGRGPSDTTVEAPMTPITAGNSVVIRGTVTDVSAGTKQAEQAADFPNGVPCMSDASMGDWMAYVYMQKPCPTNATGVTVTLDAIDPNNNFVHLGTATSDGSGLFSLAWKTPDIPGKYTVIATFAGSKSYWPSYAETAMYVSEVPTATPTPAFPVPTDYTLLIVGMGVVLLVAIAIVGILLLRKRP
jgi:outer membrane protein assembly factor BamB